MVNEFHCLQKLLPNKKVKFGAIEISRGSKAQRREVIRK